MILASYQTLPPNPVIASSSLICGVLSPIGVRVGVRVRVGAINNGAKRAPGLCLHPPPTSTHSSAKKFASDKRSKPSMPRFNLGKVKMPSKVLFFRSKVLTPTTLRRPSALTTGRVRPVYRHGRFPNTPTMPAEPMLPPMSPAVDRGSSPPPQNPVKSLKPHPLLTTQYSCVGVHNRHMHTAASLVRLPCQWKA